MTKKQAASDDSLSTYFCQVDTYLGVKDYLRGGRCVRLIGVSESDHTRFVQQEVRDGVISFVIDVDIREFVRGADPTRTWHWRNGIPDWIAKEEHLALGDRPWYRVEVEEDKSGRSYSYRTFSAALPNRFRVVNVTPIKSLELAPLLPSHERRTTISLASKSFETQYFASAPFPPSPIQSSSYKLSAFHVGQGMCSVVYNEKRAVLFDAGAGTPVTRKRYLTEVGFQNDLRTLVMARAIPYLVLSHYDYDHWRLLAWDEALRNKVQEVIAPDVNGVSIAFFDTQLAGKVKKWADFRIALDKASEVLSKRSTPAYSDSNGECLVTVVKLGSRKALLPGDYVYTRIASDANPWIQHLAHGPYAAVVVPHHGDAASAMSPPTASAGAKAFFSAGDHKGYDHPKKVSEDAHATRKFTNVMNKHQPHVVEHQLL